MNVLGPGREAGSRASDTLIFFFFLRVFNLSVSFPVDTVVKNPPTNAGDTETQLDPWVRKVPWRRARQPTPVFLPGESHGQRSLVGYSCWDRKESATTE